MKIKLSKANIDALQPGDKRYIVRDTEQHGLCVRVGTNGSKTFLLNVKHNGQSIKRTIGRMKPDGPWSVGAARHEAGKLLQVMRGRVDEMDIPLQDLYELHTTRLPREKPLTEATLKGYRLSWQSLPDHIRNMSAMSLTRWELQKWYDEKCLTSPTHAKNTAALMKAMMTTGLKKGKITSNPLSHFTVGASIVDEVFPGKKEIKGVVRKLVGQKKHTCYLVPIVTLFTGCRLSTVLGMRWQDISGDVWHTPSTKNKTRYQIPLHPLLLEMIEALPRQSEWVFTSRYGTKMRDIKFMWSKAKIPFTMRSVKKTFMMFANEQTNNLAVLKTLGQHKIVKDITLDVYVRPDPDTMRKAYLATGDAIVEVVGKDIFEV